MGKSSRSSLPKTAISRNDIRQIESEWLALKNTYCTSRTTTTVTVSFKDSQTNVLITNARVTAYLNYNLLVTDSSVDGSDGTITFNVDCVGNFSGTVTADGFVSTGFWISVDSCGLSQTYTNTFSMDPVSDRVTIQFTWGSPPADNPDDLDIWVVSVKNSDDSITCVTYFDDKTSCTDISLATDQTSGGLNGPENVTLSNPSVNKDYTYIIGIEDYKWTLSNKDDIINSAATITIQNSKLVQTETEVISSTDPAPSTSQ